MSVILAPLRPNEMEPPAFGEDAGAPDPPQPPPTGASVTVWDGEQEGGTVLALLNRRQHRSFNQIADLWRPSAIDIEDDQAAYDLAYADEPDYIGVPCRLVEQKEINSRGPVGRGDYDIFDTTDRIKFAYGQEVGDGWLIVMRSPTDPLNAGQAYITQGNAQDRPSIHQRRANQRSLLVKKAPRPRNCRIRPLPQMDRLPAWSQNPQARETLDSGRHVAEAGETIWQRWRPTDDIADEGEI